jgi:hypothetical protein
VVVFDWRHPLTCTPICHLETPQPRPGRQVALQDLPTMECYAKQKKGLLLAPRDLSHLQVLPLRAGLRRTMHVRIYLDRSAAPLPGRRLVRLIIVLSKDTSNQPSPHSLKVV